MLIKNITDRSTPKPIGIGSILLMPGKSENISDEIAYVDEFDKMGKKTGKKIILPSVAAMSRLNQLEYTETKKPAPKKVVEEKPVEVEEVVAKPKRTRKKAEVE